MHVFIRLAVLSLALSVCLPASAQKQGNIWYFGVGAGLDFNSGTPVALTDGQITTPGGGNPDNNEGSSVICDNQGRLLFYTNGELIWNRKHMLMPTGVALQGNFSSTQSSLIVPKPGSSRYFYIFTTDAFLNDLRGGFRYSIVDMCLDNGYGDVMVGEHDKLLLDTVAEKLSAVRHVNGVDYWIVVHKYFSDAFYAYHLTSTGIMPPVISHAGAVHQYYCYIPPPYHAAYNGTINAMGWMNFSPNGQKLALVTAQSCKNIAEVFDFDRSTGQVTNPIPLATDTVALGLYGTCFSPNSSKLYISSFINRNYIYQFDLTAGTGSAADVNNSSTIVASKSSGPSVMAMQLGPDGKIYVAERNTAYLGVIQFPNVAGASCYYNSTGVSLNGRQSTAGLPNFIAGYDYSNGPLPVVSISLGNDTSLCMGGQLLIQPQVFSVDPITYLWQDNSHVPSYTATASGKYYVTVSNGGCSTTDTINVIIAPPLNVNLGNDTSICADTSIVLNAAHPPATYLWSTGSHNDHIVVKNAGTYWVMVNRNSCSYYDTIQIDTSSVVPISLGFDSAYCFHQPVVLNTPPGLSSYVWSDGSSGSTLTAYTPGTYWIKGTRGVCTLHDTIELKQQVLPIADLGNDRGVCKENNPTTLDAQNAGSTYAWNDLSTSQTISAMAPGTFSVIVTNQYGCQDTDVVVLDTFPSPVVSIGPDTLVCTGSTIAVDAGPGFSAYRWNNNDSVQSTFITAPATCSVTVKNQYGCIASDEKVISERSKPLIPLQSEIRICGLNFLLDGGNNFIAYKWQDSSSSQTFRVTEYGVYSVTVTDSFGCSNSLSIAVENNCPPKLFVPNAFTPNADQLNDTFKAETYNVISLTMKIYNRWGQLLFETSELGKGWNGMINSAFANADVYVYTIVYTGINNEVGKTSGNFTLLR